MAGVVALEQQRLQRQATSQAYQIAQSIRAPVGAALWQVDRDALALLIEPLVREGSIVAVRVLDGDKPVVEASRAGRRAESQRKWSLPLVAPGEPGPIGRLEIEESYDALQAVPGSVLAVLLATEAFKVALVVALVLWLVHRMLAEPLRELARDLGSPSAPSAAGRIVLKRTPPPEPDELDDLVDTINRLQDDQAAELARRTAAEQREREQATERELILSSLAEGVIAFDRRARPLYANRAITDLLEASHAGGLEAALQRAFGDEVEFWRRVFGELRAVAKSSRRIAQRRIRQSIRRKDGERMPVEISLTALPTGSLGYVAIARDVSAELEAAQAMAESRAARAADRAKSEFLSRMSHELRTPLNAVLGFSDLLLHGANAPLDGRQRALVGHVRGAGEHLLRLISDLLDLSRIETGTLSLVLEPVAIGPLVAETVELIAPQAAQRNIALSVHIDGPVPAWARIDKTRFRQVLMNLLSNAVKYNREAGSITVDVRAGSAVTLTVTDTGIGLTPIQLQQLFTPFNRLGREASAIEGSGIGLVIARHLVQMMGGTLECHSEAGQGSSFLIGLPLAGPAGADPAEAGDPVTAPGSLVRPGVRGSLLVVEDNEVNRLMLEMYLQQRPGISVDYAADVDAAVAMLASRAPQVALIDMNLGGRSGTEVLQAVRARYPGDGVRCVAFSADALPEQVQQTLAAGFDGYWVKPMGLDEFLDRIDRALDPAMPRV